jgi:hypothetical protein
LFILLTRLQGKKKVSYKESDSEGEDDDEVIFRPNRKDRVGGRATKRRRTEPESEDEFNDVEGDAEISDDGMLRNHMLLSICLPLTWDRNGRFRRSR